VGILQTRSVYGFKGHVETHGIRPNQWWLKMRRREVVRQMAQLLFVHAPVMFGTNCFASHVEV